MSTWGSTKKKIVVMNISVCDLIGSNKRIQKTAVSQPRKGVKLKTTFLNQPKTAE